MLTSHRLTQVLALVSFVFITHASTTQAAIIGLELDSPFASIGESVTLDISVGDLGAFSPESLGAFDVTVGYDAALLSFSSYSLGDYLGNPGAAAAFDASSGDIGGAINVAVVSLLSIATLDALQPGEFILASLTFDVTGLANGSTTQFSILPGLLLANTSGSSLPATGNFSTSLQGRAPVPLPGTLLLLLGGLSSYGFVLRLTRRSRKRQ